MDDTAPKRHFADLSSPIPVATPVEHYFEQLNLDLDWPLNDLPAYMMQNRLDALSALEKSFRAIAGRRWSRFKEAEAAGETDRAKEMEAFARLWYRISNQIGVFSPKGPPRTPDELG